MHRGCANSIKCRRRVVETSQGKIDAGDATTYSINEEDRERLNLNQLNVVFISVGFPRRDTAKIVVGLDPR